MTDLNPEEETGRAEKPARVVPGGGLGAVKLATLALPGQTSASSAGTVGEEAHSQSSSVSRVSSTSSLQSLIEESVNGAAEKERAPTAHVGQADVENSWGLVKEREASYCHSPDISEDTATLLPAKDEEEPNHVGVHFKFEEDREISPEDVPQIHVDALSMPPIVATPDAHGDTAEIVMTEMYYHDEVGRLYYPTTVWKATLKLYTGEQSTLELRSDFGVCVNYPPPPVTYCRPDQ